ncbi:hypothetical protein [Lewinella sp. 4G2]|uniref:hypothetical protein n=1 Tax=Lewinella sp. 4G2 TaxID=1803372 RepID=UPI0007B4A83C|nr:hypothetical protein [Lewinella sp. 4G2]OAV42622.1 hypothetical protein A3850_015355 [Lewinella sp. 4G2]
MSRLISLLFFVAVAYGAWFYLKDYSRGPVEVRLVQADLDDISRISLLPKDGRSELFRLQRGEGNQWMATRKQRLLLDRDGKIARFVDMLASVTSDSTIRKLPKGEDYRTVEIRIRAQGEEEGFSLHFTRSAQLPVYASWAEAEEVLALPPSLNAWREEYLHFDAYRERRLLNLLATEVDSISVLKQDSLLWGINIGDLSATAQRFIAPAAAPHADYFDEIAHRDREFAKIKLYHGAAYKTITVYRDSLWPSPFVLNGEDYPRRFLGYDALR